MAYDLEQLKAPRSAGGMLRLFVSVAESRTLGGAVARKFLRDIGVVAMRALPSDDAPWDPFSSFPEVVAGPAGAVAEARDPPPGAAERAKDFPFETVDAFTAAYREKTTTPVDVAERVLLWRKESDKLAPPMRVFIAQDDEDVLKQARASAARWKEGKPLGPLDGVPLAVKDELDQRPYPTTVGTKFLGTKPCAADAEPVARLRAAGALLIGKANMHEIGMGVSGLNPHHGPARNPYDPGRATGGSSSGPAAAVASGFCPVALGADGGGSVRIPASLCGLVGLKPTFGRVSERGAAPLCWSLAHIGPLAASVRDTALAYAVIAGRDEADPHTRHQPAPTIAGWNEESLKGVRLGLFPAWFEHADAAVVAGCRKIVDALKDAGAEIVEIEVPELGLLRTIHMLTIASEMQASQILNLVAHRRELGADVRLNLAITKHVTSGDWVHAQRHRTRLCRHFAGILGQVDAIVTPTTACTAPPLRDDALRTGDSDLALGDRIMRNCLPANVTGLPAISFPAGYDEQGLPIGFQAMGRAWEEALLLRLAAVAERSVERRTPKVHRGLLGA